MSERYEERCIERVLLHESTILRRLDDLALELGAELEGKPVTVVCVLHGSLFFAADLLRRLHFPLKVTTLAVESYHGRTSSSGEVTFAQLSLPDVDGQVVLLLDDILDSGRTMAAVKARLEGERDPMSVRTCVLLDKKTERAVPMSADHVAFEIGDEFVVGYGLDFQGRFRNLPYIGTLRADYVAKELEAVEG
jgi:hypoxanthine phosphoribosyltransferase